VKGLAGAGLYVLSHGLLKGALFICVGNLLSRVNSVDELHLRGRAGALLPTGIVFAVCALAVAGPPPLGTFLGKSLIEESASTLDYYWVPVVVVVASIVTSGAMLRAAGRVFLGLGPPQDPYLSPEPDEEREVERNPTRSRTLMLLPAASLAFAGVALGLVPGLERHAEEAARRFESTRAYVAGVLGGRTERPPVDDFSFAKLPTTSVLLGTASVVGALLVALLALYRERAGAGVGRVLRGGRPVVLALRALHSGVIGDYVTWLVVGVAVLGGVFAVVVR
jgi:multicomponent Na+:H+ antiporter subunit D